MSKFKDLQKKIAKIIKKSPYFEDRLHSKLVHKNVLKLKSDADEALQIAALAHDIERAVPGQALREQFKTRKEYKHIHSIRSAKVTAKLLKQFGYKTALINKVTKLIEQHEIGKSDDAQILKQADSIAFFQDLIKYYCKRFSRDRTKKKIRYMYNRLNKPAQQIVKKLKLSKKLKQIIGDALNKK